MKRPLILRLTLGAALAPVLFVLLTPAVPRAQMSSLAGLAAGVPAGLLLYLAVARRRPYVPPLAPAALAACGVIVIAAASEEVVWRRVVLGELLRIGPLAAVAGSTLAFALVHKGRQGLHLGTGAAFACVYLATGVLAAAIAAHSAYNVLLITLAERRARRGAEP